MSTGTRLCACAMAGFVLAGCTSASTSPAVDVHVQPTVAAAAPPGVAGPGTTGVPAGTALTPSDGLTITQDGQVVDGLAIDGCVVVSADDVTIRNSRIRCADDDVDRAVTSSGGVTGFLIQDSEVDGMGVVDIGIDISSSTIRRVNVHRVNDGIRLGSDIVLEDSWVHDLARQGDGHPDAVQGISAHDVVIRGNTLDPRSETTDDLGNAAIMLGSEAGTERSSNIIIDDNLLDGGNYAVNIRGDIRASNFTIRGNTFGSSSRYGPMISPSDDEIDIAADNVLSTTNEEIDVDRP